MMTERSQELLAEVRANRARLESCPGQRHDFVEHGPKRVLLQRYVCTRCKGEVDSHARYWFSIGLQAAASPP